MEQVLFRVYLSCFVVDVNGRHSFLHSFPRTTLFVYMLSEIIAKIFQCALQRFHCSRSKGAEGVSGSKELGLEGERVKVLTAPISLLHSFKDFFCPGQAAPARSTPTI